MGVVIHTYVENTRVPYTPSTLATQWKVRPMSRVASDQIAPHPTAPQILAPSIVPATCTIVFNMTILAKTTVREVSVRVLEDSWPQVLRYIDSIRYSSLDSLGGLDSSG